MITSMAMMMKIMWSPGGMSSRVRPRSFGSFPVTLSRGDAGLLAGERGHHLADLLRHRSHVASAGACGVLDVHVHEASLRRGLVTLALEEPDAVDDRGPSDPLDDEPDVDGLGEADLAEVAARRLRDDADGRQLADVRAGGVDQVRVDGGVDQLVVGRVVHVPVDVVVSPPGGCLPPHHVIATGRPRRTLGGGHAGSRSRWLMTAETPSPRMLTPYSASP